MKLTDTHLVLLSAAAQHEERLLPRPDRLTGKATRSLATRLIRAGLAEEVSVQHDQPHWDADDDARPVGLRITGAGLAAIGLDRGGRAAALLHRQRRPDCDPPGLPAPAASRPLCSVCSCERRAPPSMT